jgi:predicted nucleic acid-binding protein
MKISLDANVWIFGLLGNDAFCERIVTNLSCFDVIVSNQIRTEVEHYFEVMSPQEFCEEFGL